MKKQLVKPQFYPGTVHLEENYKVLFTRFEWMFIRDCHWMMISDPKHRQHRVLELSVFHEFHRKRILKIVQLTGETKIKMTAAEVIALKRLLKTTELPNKWATEGNSLLFKLDQLTVGIQ